MPSKNNDFRDFSKNCEKLEKSQNLLKLINSRLEEVEGCPAKTAISPQIAKNWRNLSFSKIN